MKVGIIGAGTMGQGIAKAFAQVDGYEVALCDIKQEWAEGGKAKIAKGYDRLVQKGKLTQEAVDAILAKITPGLKEDLCADCDLIVEAAFENMEVKKTTFSELDKIAKPECIFASNTSSLSITEIGNGLTRPMIGMHFFNPADRMKLVEVIAGVNTPAETVDAIKKIAEEIGKTPVQVNEAAGFVVNRILVPMINEAAFIKMEGVSDIAGIDAAMKLGANHPMGPLELGDFIGLDICLAIMETIYYKTGNEFWKKTAQFWMKLFGINFAIGVATGSDGFAPLFPTDIIIHHAASNNLTIHIAFNLGNETDAHAHDLRGTDLLSSLYSLLISSSRIIKSANPIYFHRTSLCHIKGEHFSQVFDDSIGITTGSGRKICQLIRNLIGCNGFTPCN